MNRIFSTLGFSLWIALVSPMVMAASLKALDVAALPGDRVELKLSFDGPPPQPKGYTTESPARIALDLPGVTSQMANKNLDLGSGNARTATVAEAKDRTRLIVSLTQLAPYSTRVEGNNLFVVVGQGASATAPRPAAVAPRAATAATAAAAPARPAAQRSRAIRGVDFQRGTEGEGNVVIDLSDPTIAPDIQEHDGKIILSFARTQLPEKLRVRLDVKDFATPVQFVNAALTGDRTVISVEPSGTFDYSTFQTDNKLTVSVRPMSIDDLQKRNADRQAYVGDKLSLNFQDIDVRSVLQLIADFTNLNLVASDTVQGGITLRLQNVPWDQALDLVLKTKGLDKRKIGNVLLSRRPMKLPLASVRNWNRRSRSPSWRPCVVSCCKSITPRQRTLPSCSSR
jgi:type IV pilus assembly protein PilQ